MGRRSTIGALAAACLLTLTVGAQGAAGSIWNGKAKDVRFSGRVTDTSLTGAAKPLGRIDFSVLFNDFSGMVTPLDLGDILGPLASRVPQCIGTTRKGCSDTGPVTTRASFASCTEMSLGPDPFRVRLDGTFGRFFIDSAETSWCFFKGRIFRIRRGPHKGLLAAKGRFKFRGTEAGGDWSAWTGLDHFRAHRCKSDQWGDPCPFP